MVAFVVGGFFSSMAYNDITWLTFATVAAMDRISLQEAREIPGRAEAHTTPDVSTTLTPESTWRPPERRA